MEQDFQKVGKVKNQYTIASNCLQLIVLAMSDYEKQRPLTFFLPCSSILVAALPLILRLGQGPTAASWERMEPIFAPQALYGAEKNPTNLSH